jgi:hypothetical protein
MIFFLCSGTRHNCTYVVIFLIVDIAAIEYFVLINTWAWEVLQVIGGSGAIVKIYESLVFVVVLI